MCIYVCPSSHVSLAHTRAWPPGLNSPWSRVPRCVTTRLTSLHSLQGGIPQPGTCQEDACNQRHEAPSSRILAHGNGPFYASEVGGSNTPQEVCACASLRSTHSTVTSLGAPSSQALPAYSFDAISQAPSVSCTAEAGCSKPTFLLCVCGRPPLASALPALCRENEVRAGGLYHLSLYWLVPMHRMMQHPLTHTPRHAFPAL